MTTTGGAQLTLPAVRRLPPCLGCGSPVERRRDSAVVFVDGERRGRCHVQCFDRWASSRWTQRQIDGGAGGG